MSDLWEPWATTRRRVLPRKRRRRRAWPAVARANSLLLLFFLNAQLRPGRKEFGQMGIPCVARVLVMFMFAPQQPQKRSEERDRPVYVAYLLLTIRCVL